ncbi:LrgB-like family-domain-containing protein [Dipodascopsis tothii]|uniref:LrgB-like family-domain-containing protein n=1 Tax=Dipodascopsis tothii TaxID=44089 RepID=UPI0034CE7359
MLSSLHPLSEHLAALRPAKALRPADLVPSRTALVDFAAAVFLTAQRNLRRLAYNFVVVPAGTIVVLLFLYGVHRVIELTTINFPASVVCMILLFVFLLVSEATLGTRKTAAVIRTVDVPLGFALRWINTFFTTSFVLLPLSPGVSGPEVGKIAAVFLLGFVATMAFTSYTVVGLQRLFGVRKRSGVKEDLPTSPEDDEIEHDLEATEAIELSEFVVPMDAERERAEMGLGMDDDAGDGAGAAKRLSVGSAASAASSSSLSSVRAPGLEGDSVLHMPEPAHPAEHAAAGYGDHVSFGGLASYEPGSSAASHASGSSASSVVVKPQISPATEAVPGMDLPPTVWPQETKLQISYSLQAELWAARMTKYLDTIIYLAVFFCVGLPVYFTTGYSLIAQMTFTVLMLFLGLWFPAKVRRVLHPIFTCSGLTILGIYVMSVAHGETLKDGLNEYSTGKTYLHLFGDAAYRQYKPGAGDVLKSVLDVSIVSLALPMFRYRADLRRHWSILLIPNVLVGLVTFFAYPPICYAIGISPERSLAFVGRSVTLALAMPAVASLGGSASLVAVTAILSGIIGVLIGHYVLKVLRIREDDFLTRGITLGINSSAVATAHLLATDPRAGALSSLSFVVFGTTMVVLAAITPIANLVRSWVGL